jgi:hypothetical protein
MGKIFSQVSLALALSGLSLLSASASAQAATVIYSEDFENVGTDLTPWTIESGLADVDTTPSGRNFLGKDDGIDFGFNDDTVTLTLNEPLLKDSQVTLNFDLFVIGSWDGEQLSDTFAVRANGETLLDTGFANAGILGQTQAFPNGGMNLPRTGASEINSLGYSNTFGDTVYPLELSFLNLSETLQLEFDVNVTEGITGESWGLDNITLEVSSVPEPLSTLAMGVVFGFGVMLKRGQSS